MKRVLILLLFLGHYFASAQSITTAEYFYDTDPGVGNGTLLNVDTNSGHLLQSFTIATTGLSEGFHSLYIRTKNEEGNWGLYERSSLYIATFNTGLAISAAEYFFDSDPGVGNGTIIGVETNSGQLTQSYSIATTGLSEGFHSFYIRTLAGEKWSLYDRAIIYIKDFETSSEIVSAEYFIDSDPGNGNGTSVNIESQTQLINVDSNGLAEGEHLFYIRVLNDIGMWSFYDSAIFTIDGKLGVENSLFKTTTISPNPFVNGLLIDLKGNSVIENIQIYDFNGRTVFLSNDDLKQVNLKFLNSGLYILQIQSENQFASFKIIKE